MRWLAVSCGSLWWLAVLFGLLICFPIIVRSDGVADTESGTNKEAVAESENQEGGDEGSGDGSGSGSEDEDEEETEEDLYFYLFDKESSVIEYKAPLDEEAKDECGEERSCGSPSRLSWWHDLKS